MGIVHQSSVCACNRHRSRVKVEHVKKRISVNFYRRLTQRLVYSLAVCSRSRATCAVQEYVGKAGDVLDDVFFVVKGKVEARISKPGKQVGSPRPSDTASLRIVFAWLLATFIHTWAISDPCFFVIDLWRQTYPLTNISAHRTDYIPTS